MSDGGFLFDQHCCSITKNFRYALHDFGRVVAQADDSIAADLLCMLQTEIKRMFTRFLAKAGQNSDIASDQRLQAGSDGTEYRAGAHDDAPDDAECFYNSIPIQLKRRRGHGCIHAANL